MCRRGRGRSFQVEGLKTKGVGANSRKCGARNLEAKSIRRLSESGEYYGRVCKKDSHRDKVEQFAIHS